MSYSNTFLKLVVPMTITLLNYSSIIAQTKTQEADHMHNWNIPAWADTIKNPYAHITSAADSGKVLYLRVCSVCHGNGGKGDGIAAAGLATVPANHTSSMVQSHSDGSLFYEISNGHAPMPSYKAILTDKQRWQLVCFIRTLKSKSPKK